VAANMKTTQKAETSKLSSSFEFEQLLFNFLPEFETFKHLLSEFFKPISASFKLKPVYEKLLNQTTKLLKLFLIFLAFLSLLKRLKSKKKKSQTEKMSAQA